jgi:CDP-paratose 2-epimerase
MKKILVTGSSGLIGSEVSTYFASKGWQVNGVDNNQRAIFFGPQGDTRWNQERLIRELNGFKHWEVDIRDREGIRNLVASIKPDAIVHTAAQPSHDKAVQIPFDDFETNAVGTLNLLEATRSVSTDIPFVHMSTNKVYGDAPNNIKMKELERRWDYDDSKYIEGINEEFTIDQSTHSLFGASKLSADILVQEYGRYFGMKSCVLRGGCLTGPNHSGVELHGFLSYLIQCNLEGRKYNIFGYKGKQVRDNIHSLDVARFIDCFINEPRVAEVYNIGGGKANTCSIIEAFDIIQNLSSKEMRFEYQDTNRIGDHICYYSDLSKMKSHYSNWSITVDLNEIFEQIYQSFKVKLI